MTRRVSIHTPLGDELHFRELRGQENISQLFSLDVEMLSESESIDPKALLGKNATIEIETQGGGRRYIDGIVTRFGMQGQDHRHYAYKARLSPWLWLATRKHGALPGGESIPFYPPEKAAAGDQENIHAWQLEQEIKPCRHYSDDYDFKKPKADLTHLRRDPPGHAHDGHEIYEWPGGYTQLSDGEDKWVGNDRRKTIDRDETSVIHRDRTETVDRNEDITVHNNRTERVDHDEKISIGDNRRSACTPAANIWSWSVKARIVLQSNGGIYLQGVHIELQGEGSINGDAGLIHWNCGASQSAPAVAPGASPNPGQNAPGKAGTSPLPAPVGINGPVGG